jgi:DNA-binding GntR family transcriptional regulator
MDKRVSLNGLDAEKVAFQIVKKIRAGILEETFKPQGRLIEQDLAERFNVSRSPVREALLALEKEGTIIISPYKGAIVARLYAAEVLDIAELRLALISLALKPAHRHLSPADFDQAHELAKRATHANSAKEHFEYNRRFWAIIFGKTQRPILCEVFAQLEDRATRYEPLLLELFPTPATRPRQRELLIELYRKGKITEAFQSFKKIYLEVVHRIIDYLETRDSANMPH